MTLILKGAVALIKVLANAQIDIHRNIERSSRLQLAQQQHRVRDGLHNIGWDGVAKHLQ